MQLDAICKASITFRAANFDCCSLLAPVQT